MPEPACFKDAVVSLEREAAAFYRRIAGAKETQTLRDVLEYFAGEEEEHARALAVMLDGASCREDVARFFEETRPLISHLVESSQDLQKLTEALHDRERILKFALSSEKDAILLYSQLLRSVSDPGTAELVKGLIQAEVRHFDTFFKVLKILRHAEKGPWQSPETVDKLLREAVENDLRAREQRDG